MCFILFTILYVLGGSLAEWSKALLFLTLNFWKKFKPEFESGSGLGQADLICGWDYVLTTSLPAALCLLALWDW